MLFGDDVGAPVEGSSPKSIMGDKALGQGKTLFQDIFGSSAFADLSHIPSNVNSNSEPQPARSTNDVAVLLDAPAYLMPPIESLFEPLIGSFLKLRFKDDAMHVAEGKEQQQDEDVDMAGQSDDEPVTLGDRRKRLVDQKEMDMFVELFRQTKGWFIII